MSLFMALKIYYRHARDNCMPYNMLDISSNYIICTGNSDNKVELLTTQEVAYPYIYIDIIQHISLPISCIACFFSEVISGEKVILFSLSTPRDTVMTTTSAL